MWLCCPKVHAPLGGSTEGARQSWFPARHPDSFSSVTMLLVAKRIATVRSTVAAPVGSPAPMVIGSRCPAEPVDYQTGS